MSHNLFDLKDKYNVACWIGVTFLSCFLFFSALRSDDFSEREAREALAVYEMSKGAGFFLPKINGDTFRRKPPLFHWMGYGISKAMGEVDELSVRMPSALCATASVLLTFWFGTFLFGRRAGLISALILATSVEYLEMANLARIDMTLTLFVLLSYIFFYVGYKNGRKVYFLLFFVAMGLAVLTKGPVGLIFPVLTIVLFLVMRKETAFLREMNFPKGILVVLLFISLWLIPALFIGRWELVNIIYQETIARFVGASAYQSHHVKPFYFYFPRILAGFAPWSFFLPAALVFYYKEAFKDGALMYVILWFVSIFFFLSLSAGKRGDYLLPLYPAAALIVGKAWGDFIGRENKLHYKPYFSIASFLVLAAGALFSLVADVLFFSDGSLHNSLYSFISSLMVREDQKSFEYFMNYYENKMHLVSIFIFIVSSFGIAQFITLRREKFARSFSLLILMLLFIAVGTIIVLPELNRHVSLKPFAEEINRDVPPNGRLAFYDRLDFKVMFYSGRHIPLVSGKSVKKYFKGRKPRYLIIPKSAIEKVRKKSEFPFFVVASSHSLKHNLLLLSNKKTQRVIRRLHNT